MSLSDARALENTRAKLKQMEKRYATLQVRPTEAGKEKIRDWTLLSLKKLINQFKEEIARIEPGATSA